MHVYFLIKHDDILWLNAYYILNVPWNMKNDYFRKVCFRRHMVQMVPRPLGKKNIARDDIIKVGSYQDEKIERQKMIVYKSSKSCLN